jgi:hypothetical protein
MITLENTIRDASAPSRDTSVARTGGPSGDVRGTVGASTTGVDSHAAAADAIVVSSSSGSRRYPAEFIDRARLERLAKPSPFRRDEDIVHAIGAAVATRRAVAAAVRAGVVVGAEKVIAHHDLVADFMTAYLAPQRVKSLGHFGYRTYAPPIIEKQAIDLAYQRAPQIGDYAARPTRAELGKTFLAEKNEAIKNDLTEIVARKMSGGIAMAMLYVALKSRSAAIIADRRRGLAEFS